jgi:hypothetical protein
MTSEIYLLNQAKHCHFADKLFSSQWDKKALPLSLDKMTKGSRKGNKIPAANVSK